MSFFSQEERDGTIVITLDRPPLNALSADVLEEGVAALNGLAKAPPPNGIVLTGAGDRAFTAGVDTKAANSDDPAMGRRLLWGINDIATALYRQSGALVCAINGHAIGAGGIVSLTADWSVIADTDLKIGLPEAKAGLPFPQIPQIIMDYEMDPVWRRRAALSSELYSAAKSIETGLADELVSPDALINTAVERARELQAQAAFNEIKANMRRAALAEIDAIYAERGTNGAAED